MTDTREAEALEGRSTAEETIAHNRTRLRLRRRLLLWGLPVVLILAIIAGWLVSLPVRAADSLTEYNRGDYTASAEGFGELLEPNIVEKWLPYYDRGSALAEGQDYIPAIDDLEKALAMVPEDRECVVVVNLSLSWERLADGYAQSGLFEGAQLLYQTAADVLEEHNCTPPEDPVDGREPGQEIEDAKTRLEQKLEAMQYLEDQSGTDSPTTPEEQLEELDQQEQDAAEEKAEDDARDRGQQGTGGRSDKPW
jgi:tetratricopeptide (TPR) repeat protein